MTIQIAVIGGDGVGYEVAESISDILESCFKIVLIRINAGYDHFLKTGKNLSQDDLEQINKCKGILFGSTSSPNSNLPGYISPILQLRRYFDLFVNIRPFKTRLNSQRSINLIIFRENIEGLYAGCEKIRNSGEVVAEKVVTKKHTMRLAKFVFEYAKEHNHKNITIVHKANVLKISDGLFRETCLKTGEDYPKINISEELVDATAYYLIRDPERFDIILTMNMYGDILSDVAAGMSDGIGFAPSLSIGPYMVLAEPIHGSAPNIIGKNIANPYGMLFSAVLLMKYIGLEEDANLLCNCAEKAISEGLLTPDAGGKYSTTAVISTIKEKLLSKLPSK